jgi:hypothetical protein
VSWFDDPKIARTLGRATWPLVIVVVFTLRGVEDGFVRDLTLAIFLTVAILVNGPTVKGLWFTRAQRRSKAWRAVAVLFGVRLVAILGTLWALR